MLNFSPDYSITGGIIDNWYVDNENAVIRTPIIQRAATDSATNSELAKIELGVVVGDVSLESPPNPSDKKCNERLKLLAISYSESIQPELHRDIQARLLILEHELDVLISRYTEHDWELLSAFKRSIDELNEE